MRLGLKSRIKIEEFFREHYADPDFCLPDVRFHAGPFSHLVARILVIEGITIGRHVLVYRPSLGRGRAGAPMIDPELAVHEIVHVLQYRREGFFRFIFNYLRAYRANLRRIGSSNARLRTLAYFEIPHEIEARETAAAFREWSAARSGS